MDQSLLEEVITKGSSYLVAKLHTMRTYNRDTYKNMMRKIWKLVKPIKLYELGDRLMLIEFGDSQDKERILKESPWNFDRSLVLRQTYDGRKQTS